jgi:hypothetical protein
MTDLDLAGVSRRLDAPEVRLGYLVQALGIILWWVSMAASPWVYQRFEFPGTSRADLFAFLLPDVLVVSVLSVVCWRRPSLIWAAVVWGALAYGALWCVARSLVSRVADGSAPR